MTWTEIDECIKQFKLLKTPNITFNTQTAKIEEEMDEIRKAKRYNEKRKEAIDVFLAARLNWLTFGCENSNCIAWTVCKIFDLDRKEIVEKIQKNMNRTFVEIKPGYYKHIQTIC